MTHLRDLPPPLRARLAAMLTRGALTPEVARDVQTYVQRVETMKATGTDPGPGDNQQEDRMSSDNREPNRDAFECYDVDSRCENCGKWECGAGESHEPHPWKVCPECYRCGECGHDPDCGARPDYDRDAHIADVLPLYRERARAWLAAEHTDVEESLTLLLATIAVESMP